MTELEMTKNEYKDDRQRAYAELGERLGYMISDLKRLKEKVDWAKENNQRVNIDSYNITTLVNTMMLMANTASQIAKDNEVLMALGDVK